MKRRTLLAGVATGAVGLSGCLAEGIGSDGGSNASNEDEGGDGGDGDSGGDGGSGGSDGDASTGGDGPPSVEDSTIRTTSKGCGSTDAGEATAERGDGEVTVDGVIGASNPCHRAILDAVEIHNRQLVVRVNAEREDGGCQMCIGEVEYRATVTVSNVDGLHGTTVEHADGDEHVTNWDEPENTSP